MGLKVNDSSVDKVAGTRKERIALRRIVKMESSEDIKMHKDVGLASQLFVGQFHSQKVKEASLKFDTIVEG